MEAFCIYFERIHVLYSLRYITDGSDVTMEAFRAVWIASLNMCTALIQTRQEAFAKLGASCLR